MKKITKNTKLSDLIEINPDAGGILFAYGMGCVGCAMAAEETIEQGCLAHGMPEKDIEELIKKLNGKEDKEDFQREIKIGNKKVEIKISKKIKESFVEKLKEKISYELSSKNNFLSSKLKKEKSKEFELIYTEVIKTHKDYVPIEIIMKRLKIKKEDLVGDGSVFIDDKISVRWVLVK